MKDSNSWNTMLQKDVKLNPVQSVFLDVVFVNSP